MLVGEVSLSEKVIRELEQFVNLGESFVSPGVADWSAVPLVRHPLGQLPGWHTRQHFVNGDPEREG